MKINLWKDLAVLCLSVLTSQAFAEFSTAERAVLNAFYVSTNGDQWKDNTGWGGAVGTECSWYGVSCDIDQNFIVEIYLEDNQLTGTIPIELGQLSHLIVLGLSDNNQLTGTIPVELGQLSQLTWLRLNGNQLTGTIPIELGQLSQLTDLSLNGNQLTGTIPVELGQLSQLTDLSLNGNQLTGTIPVELGQLSQLANLYLNGNQLTGTIPVELKNLSELSTINLNNNCLSTNTQEFNILLNFISSLDSMFWTSQRTDCTGSPILIPDVVRQTQAAAETALTDFSVIASTANHATIPTGEVISQSPAAGTTAASGSVITLVVSSGPALVTIPLEERAALIALYNSTHGDQWKNNTGWGGAVGTECSWYGVSCDSHGGFISRISLQNNLLTGIIPVELGQLSQLTYLGLSGNQLTGAIPVELGQLSQLAHLNLGINELAGTIPVELGQLSNLTALVLRHNQFTGTIPVELGQLSRLTFLDLSFNKLTGTIPVELAQLSQLTVLSLNYNKITGTIPVELGQLSNLIMLGLRHNKLIGIIPVELGQLSQVAHLNLGRNELAGTIPVKLGQLSQLTNLYLNGNQLTGTTPVELKNLSKLRAVNLNNNCLSTNNQELITFLDSINASLWKSQRTGCTTNHTSPKIKPTVISFTHNKESNNFVCNGKAGDYDTKEYELEFFDQQGVSLKKVIRQPHEIFDNEASFTFNHDNLSSASCKVIGKIGGIKKAESEPTIISFTHDKESNDLAALIIFIMTNSL